MKEKTMTAEEMEKLFDEGDMRYLDYFDMENAIRSDDNQEKVTLSLPQWMSDSQDSNLWSVASLLLWGSAPFGRTELCSILTPSER
ncbi:MAG: hypothetical protein LBN34_01575 [Clostridiales Family XIII bacterium]|jgi:hypothetical protein|nr:hypothetical protein [Clostridiales Family XIII bacterium]